MRTTKSPATLIFFVPVLKIIYNILSISWDHLIIITFARVVDGRPAGIGKNLLHLFLMRLGWCFNADRVLVFIFRFSSCRRRVQYQEQECQQKKDAQTRFPCSMHTHDQLPIHAMFHKLKWAHTLNVIFVVGSDII
jgi:hypothetical protein